MTELERWTGAKQALEDRSEVRAIQAEGTTDMFAQRESVQVQAGRKGNPEVPHLAGKIRDLRTGRFESGGCGGDSLGF